MEQRRAPRVGFEHGYTARIIAVDGTWHRDCRIDDVSDTGAKLHVRGSITNINTHEFFLLLSNKGGAYRRCERIWVNGSAIGVRFLNRRPSGVVPRGDEGERPKSLRQRRWGRRRIPVARSPSPGRE